MTPEAKAAALARCDAEIARIEQEAQTGEYPAWLIVMAHNDWAIEKFMISRGCEPNWPCRDYAAIRRAIREDANA